MQLLQFLSSAISLMAFRLSLESSWCREAAGLLREHRVNARAGEGQSLSHCKCCAHLGVLLVVRHQSAHILHQVPKPSSDASRAQDEHALLVDVLDWRAWLGSGQGKCPNSHRWRLNRLLLRCIGRCCACTSTCTTSSTHSGVSIVLRRTTLPLPLLLLLLLLLLVPLCCCYCCSCCRGLCGWLLCITAPPPLATLLACCSSCWCWCCCFVAGCFCWCLLLLLLLL